MSSTLKVIIWLIFWNGVVSGKLLSLNKSIRSSSIKNVNGIDLVPQKAVDGNHTTNIDCCCAMTQHDSHAWFELDLGRNYLIERIVVESAQGYFVNDGEHVEFFLVPEKDIQDVKPVKTVTPEKDIGRLNFTLPEPRESRFLTMVRRTGHKYGVFVVCELSVYGECENGKYGPDCSKDCGKCFNVEPCNKTDGTCTKCAAGYSGLMCNSHCEDGKYGSDCSKDCGKCFNKEPCNKTDGTCTRCAAGYYGFMCISQCKDGTYGPNCSKNCGKCFNQEPCNKLDGTCTRCAAGYSGLMCISQCGDGKYGPNCSKNCGKCFNQEPCNKTDGTCTRCAAGYSGLMCISQNSEGKVICPENMELLGIAIGGTTGVTLMVEGVIAAVIYVIWKRKCKRKKERLDRSAIVQRGEPRPEISGPYELADRSAFATEHPYGEGLPDYEEPETLYEN